MLVKTELYLLTAATLAQYGTTEYVLYVPKS